MDEELVIKRKPMKGDDGYKVFSVRIKEETVEALDKISSQTNRSRNELVNLFLEYAIQHCKIAE